ncbi:COP1-interacting protein 7-like [Zingiber officinale]|uniref:COP1-interacting protein 7-like n=1 Tax=Zingiber officinale TaxID=94328 RepID=UPI001C4BC251|nr:COP1-interacting protein 7-like [Zingiber officinale]
MRSDSLLDSAVFQLTPTRTRCDLVVIANGKTEKLASGLLTPFLPHLKTAQDQIAKGGYSIVLEPDPDNDAAWFTKGTVERFVRFVSTPEVLERVTTIEKEILQIENAIAIQGNENAGLSTVEDHQSKPAETFEVTKTSVDSDAGKAIVLYKPGSQPDPPDSNGSAKPQENSKVHLLKVLETRKMVLRKEQGMAFARAAAAGFDMDTLLDLISFSENFGASRLKEACVSFMDLWKKKHETGQWLEVEAVETMSMRSEFSALNASGIIFTADVMAQKDHGDSQSVYAGDMVADSNGKSDKKIPSESKVPPHPEYFQGQFQPPTYPQWPMHTPPGQPPMFQPYPMQGIPYFQNFPGSAPYFHPPYPPVEDPRYNNSRRKGSKRQAMDSKDIESEAWDRSSQSQDDTDGNPSDLENESSHGHKSHKKSGRSGKKKSGVVVIRNLNYIASQKHGAKNSEGDQQSASGSESEEESEDAHPEVRESKHKHSKRISKKDHGAKPVEYSDAYGNDKGLFGEEADSGNWQAFQSFLLNAEEKSRRADKDMFAGEKDPPSKKKQSKLEADPIVPFEQDYDEFNDHKILGIDSINGKARRMKQATSDDHLLVSSYGRDSIDNQFKEIEGSGGAYRQRSSEEFMIYGEDKQLSVMRSSDPLIDPTNERIDNALKNSSYTMTDESFLIPYRSDLPEVGSGNIAIIGMDSEIPTTHEEPQDSNDNAKTQLFYEPDELSMVPDRAMESLSIGYDPVMDYDFELPVENTIKVIASHEEDLSTNTKEEPKKSDKEKNLKASNDSLEKRRDALAKKGASSRLSLLTEAQKRAEKLRSYKGDLQKLKKEREEEERKRLDALKREREKRIAARSGPTTTQPKSHLAAKPSPSPLKGSKFSDAEPASSPLRKLAPQTSSNGFSDLQKATKSSRLNGINNGLTRSTSALPEVKKESSGLISEAKTESLRMKRLSDPKSSSTYRASTIKSATADQGPKRNVADEPQKKITEITQLDQSKSTTLPELRIKTKTLSERVEAKITTKDPVKKELQSRTSQVSDGTKPTNEKSPSTSEDNHVIEKTVVVLEDNVVAAPTVQQPDEIIGKKERSHGDGSVIAYASTHAPPSSITISQVGDSSQSKLDELQNHPEVVIPQPRSEPPKFVGSTSMEKPCEAPYAKLSSFDNPMNTVSEYDGGLSATDSETVALHVEDAMVHVSNFEVPDSGHQTHETLEKPRSKEAKGFRKLLKFGRKGHNSTSAEGNQDSDTTLDDQAIAATSSNDVSRSFSILSPFRSRNSEKKQAVA